MSEEKKGAGTGKKVEQVQAEPMLPHEMGGGEMILREGSALVRLENMTQMQISVQRPRNEAAILKSALGELDIYPEAAEEAIYSKPVGEGKTAEGLSIRAAESLANRWSNSAFGAEITSDDGTVLQGAAIFVDYEANTRRVFPFTVSRKYRAKGTGEIKTVAEDRFHDVVVPAHISKKLREAILRSLPAGLKMEYEKKARAVMAKDAPTKYGKMLAEFAKLGVSKEQVKRFIGKEPEAANAQDYEKLRGVFNAIKQGESTIEEAFEQAPAQTKPEDDQFKKTTEPLKPPEPNGNGRPKIPADKKAGILHILAEKHGADTPEKQIALLKEKFGIGDLDSVSPSEAMLLIDRLAR